MGAAVGVILLGMAACAAPAPPRPPEPAGGPLARLAAERDRDAARRLEAIYAERSAARRRAQAFSERTNYAARTPEWPHFQAELELLNELVGQVESERAVFRQMMTADPQDYVSRVRVYGEASTYLFLAMDDYWARIARRGALTVEAAKHAGTPFDEVARLERELELLQRLMVAKQHLRAVWDEFLAAMGLESLAQIQLNEQQRNARRQAAQRSHDLEAAEMLESLVVTFGVAAAVAAVLGSSASTDEERKQADDRRRLETEKDRVRSSCLPPRHYVDTGPNTPGVCRP